MADGINFASQNSDVVEQILSLSPPKTLMRFKMVSKWWYALISNPRFVDKHLSNSNSIHNNLSTCVFIKRLVVKEHTDVTKETETVFSLLSFCNDIDNDINDGDEHSFLSGVEDMDIPSPMTSLNTSRGELLGIVGHCNGIICIRIYYTSKVFLWNPAIREFKFLSPEPYLPAWPRTWSSPADFPKDVVYLPDFSNALAFGYDPKLNDYKVIEIGFSAAYCEGENYLIYPPRAVVYTRGTDSWREINTDSLETETTNLWPATFQIYFKGMCYWSGREQVKEVNIYDHMDEEYIRELIISFDMSHQVFYDIMLPDVLVFTEYRILVWNECIALFILRGSDDAESFEIWVMDGLGISGVEGSWIKHLTVEPNEDPSQWISSFWIPLKTLVLWNDELLLVSPNKCIICYNLSSKTLKYLPIQSDSNDYEVVASVYLNCIVSVMGDDVGAGGECRP